MTAILKAFAGIDVAFAKKKRLPICVCVLEGERLTPLPLRRPPYPPPPKGKGNVVSLSTDVVEQFARDTVAYLHEIELRAGVRIQCVALDAPRTYSATGRRACERAMDSLGISCIATPTKEKFTEIRAKVRTHLAEGGAENRLPHANQLWMLAGFALFEELSQGYECLEVFPHATVRILGIGEEHKSKKPGLRQQLEVVAERTGWETGESLRGALGGAGYGAVHDRLDAFMCAWVASLWPDRLTPHGEPPEDAIWVPALEPGLTSRQDAPARPIVGRKETQRDE